MIIFDLDGTLADCEHRRHLIQKPWDFCYNCYMLLKNAEKHSEFDACGMCKRNPFTWKEDWQAFYESCDQDKPIEPAIKVFYGLLETRDFSQMEIWSGRCESVRHKTESWLINNALPLGINLKMRPIGDYTPDDVLKEKWLDEAIAKGKTINFVFDDRKKVVEMWQRRGIFVFDVSQGKGDF